MGKGEVNHISRTHRFAAQIGVSRTPRGIHCTTIILPQSRVRRYGIHHNHVNGSVEWVGSAKQKKKMGRVCIPEHTWEEVEPTRFLSNSEPPLPTKPTSLEATTMLESLTEFHVVMFMVDATGQLVGCANAWAFAIKKSHQGTIHLSLGCIE